METNKVFVECIEDQDEIAQCKELLSNPRDAHIVVSKSRAKAFLGACNRNEWPEVLPGVPQTGTAILSSSGVKGYVAYVELAGGMSLGAYIYLTIFKR